MDASTTFSLRGAEGSDATAEKPKRATLQQIATRISLVILAVGFSTFGTLIIVNRDQADLNGIFGGSFIVVVGGMSAFLVGMFFLVAACLHQRFCARHAAAASQTLDCPFNFRRSRADHNKRAAVPTGVTVCGEETSMRNPENGV